MCNVGQCTPGLHPGSQFHCSAYHEATPPRIYWLSLPLLYLKNILHDSKSYHKKQVWHTVRCWHVNVKYSNYHWRLTLNTLLLYINTRVLNIISCAVTTTAIALAVKQQTPPQYSFHFEENKAIACDLCVCKQGQTSFYKFYHT